MAKRLIGVVVALVIAGGVYLFNGNTRNCNELVDISNSAVDAFNNAKSDADVQALPATLTKKSAEMRKQADDYKSPLDADAKKAADDLDKIASAITSGDTTKVDAATTVYNADVNKINGDCKS